MAGGDGAQLTPCRQRRTAVDALPDRAEVPAQISATEPAFLGQCRGRPKGSPRLRPWAADWSDRSSGKWNTPRAEDCKACEDHGLADTKLVKSAGEHSGAADAGVKDKDLAAIAKDKTKVGPYSG